MTQPEPLPSATAREANARLSRILVALVLALLAAGLAGSAAGAAAFATPALGAACGVLLLMPILNVAAELVDEVRRRDWAFALAAAVVLTLIGYTAIDRLG